MSARYIMIGGFLGAGKTTAVARLGDWLRARGRSVGLITNDQGSQLVDSLILSRRGFAVEEISGGCFCCRFASLKDAADRLTAATTPDTFIAEPVGSCTDLVATVSYPLRRLYGDGFSVAPLSVVIDPLRAARILGVEAAQDGKRFSPKVVYIYLKQLEEADIIVINKRDLIDGALLARLDAALKARFPRARRFAISARSGEGLEAWFSHLDDAQQGAGTAMGVDYDTYAEGEALLGWYNATVAVGAVGHGDGSIDGSIDGNQLVVRLCALIQAGLAGAQAEIAHLKMTLSPEDGSNEIATINLVQSDRQGELAQALSDDLAGGQLVINLRAEGPPAALEQAVEEALRGETARTPGLTLAIEHRECFRPGRPVPTHRLTSMGAPR
jgi:G3E family GTPase